MEVRGWEAVTDIEGFEESLFLYERSRLFSFIRIGWCLRKPSGIHLSLGRLSFLRKVLLSGEEALKVRE